MNCEYSEIVNLESNPELPPQYAWSKATCEFSTLELIQSVSTDAEFYLDKKINYGDILIIVFLSIFTIFIICKAIAGFIFQRN